MWDQLKPSDIERVKNELGARREEMLARHAEELKGLDAEQSQLETLEQAIDMFLQKVNQPAAAGTVVELRQRIESWVPARNPSRELRHAGSNRRRVPDRIMPRAARGRGSGRRC